MKSNAGLLAITPHIIQFFSYVRGSGDQSVGWLVHHFGLEKYINICWMDWHTILY